VKPLLQILLGFFINFAFYLMILTFVNEDDFKSKLIKKFVNNYFIILSIITIITFVVFFNSYEVCYEDNFVCNLANSVGGFFYALIRALMIFFFPTGIYFGVQNGDWLYFLNIFRSL